VRPGLHPWSGQDPATRPRISVANRRRAGDLPMASPLLMFSPMRSGHALWSIGLLLGIGCSGEIAMRGGDAAPGSDARVARDGGSVSDGPARDGGGPSDAPASSVDARARTDGGPRPDAGPRVGPLAALPSPPGAHIARIEALAANEWIELGTPAPDPTFGVARGRSWGGRALILAPEIRGAYFTGEGVHAFVKPDGHAMDDVFVYDINAHRWIAVYGGTDTLDFDRQVRDGERTVDENGEIVDETGQPIPIHILIHAWDLLAYDTRAGRFAMLAGTSMGRYFLGGLEQMEEGVATLEAERATRTIPPMSPWFYDTTAGRFERSPIASGQPDVGGYPFFQYLESSSRYFLGGAGGVAFYDPATGTWTLEADTGPRPPSYDHGGCYDPTRERIYMGPGDDSGGIYIYDIATATWAHPSSGGTVPSGMRTNDASVFCDLVNDVVTVFRYRDRVVLTYDPDTDAWSSAPFPEGRLTMSYASYNAFYDPELNAYFVHEAGDSGEGGVMWAYRYR
jgi:hypothetical protein